MEVLITAKTYDDKHILEDIVIENYRKSILSVYMQLEQILDTSLLNSIIIPEDYKNELFEFQRKNGHSEFVTENEYGKGHAQVVSSESENGDTVYNVIINKSVIFALVSDDALQRIKDYLAEDEQYISLFNARLRAINTIFHELVHVHEHSINNNIEWLQKIDEKTDLQNQYKRLALRCWSEYFACRIASATFNFKPENCYEIIGTCKDVELMLQKKRSKYNCRIITLDEFVIEFHNYTNFILKKIASEHGNLFSLMDEREDVIQMLENRLEETYIKKIWFESGKELDKLFDKYPNWEDHTILDGLIELIVKYHNQFEIYINETPEGIHYDIPVRI
ncbi:MAG: hypothetical protein K0S34_22 [Bacillales bacterium]|jgi:hypothetical protein|nr:hypothetical protein [Bacillales bacterium]